MRNQLDTSKSKIKHNVMASFFFFFLKRKMGFTPRKAEQPLQGMVLQEEKKQKKIKAYRKSLQNELQLIGVCYYT